MSDPQTKRAAARADLCRLLSACYYQPGPEFLEEDVFGAMRAAAADALPAVLPIVEAMRRDFSTQPMQSLEVDYTALLLHPGGALASPYESVWLAGSDQMLAEQAIQAVRASYADAGFAVDEDFRDLPDHIAAELEFLYALVFREARARSMADERDATVAIQLRRQFVAAHLGRWVADFSQALRSHAETGFYRSLADLTESVVAAERA